MTGSFLDTTILVHLSEAGNPDCLRAETFVASHAPAEVPYYALREIQSGRLRILCDAHNVLLSAENPGEAMLALFQRSPAEGRTREARVVAVADALQDAFSANPNAPRGDAKREMLNALALKAASLWLKARSPRKVDTVQPLSCFNDGAVSFGESGELRGPSDSFNCLASQRCAAAAYLYDDKVALQKMIDILKPEGIGEALGAKNENVKRRKALKELQSKGPVAFSKSRCRALGDAYFAAMCPPGSAVATSNLPDHEPLCRSLGKTVLQP